MICEGFPDAYIANSAGYDAVAVLGTANATPAPRRAPRAAARDGRSILALDGDDAGRHAANSSHRSLSRRGIMVIELPLPSGTDFNSWVHKARSLPDLGRLDPRPIAGPTRRPRRPCRAVKEAIMSLHSRPLAGLRRRAAGDSARRDHRHSAPSIERATGSRAPRGARRRRRLPRRPPARAGRVPAPRSPAGWRSATICVARARVDFDEALARLKRCARQSPSTRHRSPTAVVGNRRRSTPDPAIASHTEPVRSAIAGRLRQSTNDDQLKLVQRLAHRGERVGRSASTSAIACRSRASSAHVSSSSLTCDWRKGAIAFDRRNDSISWTDSTAGSSRDRTDVRKPVDVTNGVTNSPLQACRGVEDLRRLLALRR